MAFVPRALVLAAALLATGCSWSAQNVRPPLGEKTSQNSSLQRKSAPRGGTVERHADNGQPCAREALEGSSSPSP